MDTGGSSGSNHSLSRIESEMGTMFILDMMKQKREKLMRLKKDELINELAKQQKERMMMARRGQAPQARGGPGEGTAFKGVQYFERQTGANSTR